MGSAVPEDARRGVQTPLPDVAPRSVLDLSVVIPVYNEEDNLPVLWSELRQVLEDMKVSFEVLMVDDGSRDRSAEIIRAFAESDPRVRLVKLKTNAGETAATDAGFKRAGGRWIVTMDADLQNDPGDIPMLVGHLDRWDAATGWRVKRDDGVVRRISSRIANRVRNALSEEDIRDSGCTFRAFRRECLRGLVLYRGLHRFLPTLLRMRGFRVTEVPVQHRPRRFGTSKYGILNRALVAFVDLLVIRWMKDRILRYDVAEDVGGHPVDD